MKRTVYFPEIFEMMEELTTDEERISILHKFKNEKGFLDILRMCYDPMIKWVVTRAEIEHLVYQHMDIADYDLAPTTLFLEARRRLYNYTNLRQPPLPRTKIFRLISGMFSVLHHNEVELFKQMVDGNIEETGITADLIRKAFPRLIHDDPNKVKDVEPEPEEPKNVIPVPEPVVDTLNVPTIEVVNEKDVEPKPEIDPNPKPEPVKKKRKRMGPKSKLDQHKKAIFEMLNAGNTKISIAKKFKTSAGNLANWIKKNKPLDKKD